MFLILYSISDGISTIVYIYFSEITSQKIRNKAFGFFFIAYYVITICVNFIDYLFTEKSYLFLFLLLTTIFTLPLSFYMIRSPYFEYKRGNVKKVKKIFRQLAKINFDKEHLETINSHIDDNF